MITNGESVTRLRAPEVTDAYNAKRRNWANATSTTIPDCGIAPGGSLEPDAVDRNSVISDFEVIAPGGTDVLPSDRLVVRGRTCEVHGIAAQWISPLSGWAPGVVISVKIVEG